MRPTSRSFKPDRRQVSYAVVTQTEFWCLVTRAQSDRSCLVPSDAYVAVASDEHLAEGRWPIRLKARCDKAKLWICFSGPISQRSTKGPHRSLTGHVLKHSWKLQGAKELRLEQQLLTLKWQLWSLKSLKTCAGPSRCFINSRFSAHPSDRVSQHAGGVYQVFWDSQTRHSRGIWFMYY